jgi:NADH:ubiquinone oxidoreductase subunit 5 (subunit L)/multisubunit Na+/H+ antiporter MnhA subunit
MLFGVCSNALLQLLIGWEGVGIMSYLLINFYDFRAEANRSGMKALFINKLGDMGLLAGIITVYTLFLSIKINNINSLAYYFKSETLLITLLNIEISYLLTITFLFLVAASTKSAQLIFNI